MTEPLSILAAVVAATPPLGVQPFVLALVAALGVIAATVGAMQLRQTDLIVERLGVGSASHSLEELEMQRSFYDRVVAPLMHGSARLVLRYTPHSTIESYRHKLVLAGSSVRLDVRDFLGIKGLLAIGLPAAYVFGGGLLGFGSSLVITVALIALGFRLPDFVLARRIAMRQHAITRALPDTLDLLMICVEAGLGFDGAMGRVAEKRDDELAREFGRMLTEMRMGRTRRDALRSVAERTNVQDVNTFVSAVVQAEQLGVSVSKVLVTQSAQMRVRRRQRAEESAHKAPVKMLFPMVFLIFPAIFVVILGPALPGVLKMLK